MSASSGDVLPDRAQGLFVADTRVVSTWQLRVDGTPVEPLTTIEDDSYRATFVARIVPRRGLADSTLLVQRTRYVGNGVREDLLLRNVGRVVTQPQLLRELWGPTHQEDTHYLRILVGKLRQKLGDEAAAPRWIATEPGVGLRFVDRRP